MIPSPHLLVRADNRRGVGAGHVLRQVALAEAWARRGGRTTFALDDPDGPLGDRVRSTGAAVVGAGDWLQIDLAPDAVVLDGYELGPSIQAEARATGAVVAVVDDHGRHGRYEADLVVDQNLGPRLPAHDARPPGSGLLLGPRYALLRREFLEVVPAEAGDGPVVVLAGGADADAAGVLADGIRTALAPREVEVTTPSTAGASTSVAALLASASVVVSAAGSTAWELCHLARPAVLYALADNQEPIGQALADAGAARWLGRREPADPATAVAAAEQVAALLDDADARASLGDAGGALVDGHGATRVATELHSLLVDLRPAARADAELLWVWANDAAVRDASFCSDFIPLDEHRAWFAARLADPGTHLWLAEGPGGLWGQVRFQQAGAEAIVDVSLAPGARGTGAAPGLLRAATRRLFAETATTRVRARIKADNVASQATFRAADYELDTSSRSPGDVVELVYPQGRDGRG